MYRTWIFPGLCQLECKLCNNKHGNVWKKVIFGSDMT